MKLLVLFTLLFSNISFAEKFFQDKLEENDKKYKALNIDKFRKSHTEVYCRMKLLKDLGWFVADGSHHYKKSFSKITGKMCNKQNVWDTLFDTNQILYINPKDVQTNSTEELKAKLDDILSERSSYCSYKMLIGGAAKVAIDHYTAKGEGNSTDDNYFFGASPMTNAGWSSEAGTETCSSLKSKMPSNAIKCTYGQPCDASLAQGLQLAEFAMLYESYNINGYHSTFDEEYYKSEFTLGNMNEIYKRSNPFHGKAINTFSTIQDIKDNGIQGFRGVSGYLKSPASDKNHHFLIYDITPEAVTSYAKNGASYYNELYKSIINGSEESRSKLYEDAFTNETKIYSHQYGAMSYGELIESLSSAYPKDVLSLVFYKNVFKKDLFPRYKKSIIRKCRDEVHGAFKCSVPKLISASKRSVTKEVTCTNSYLKPVIISDIKNCYCSATGYQAPVMPGERRKIKITCNSLTPNSFYSKSNSMSYMINNRNKRQSIIIKGEHKY